MAIDPTKVKLAGKAIKKAKGLAKLLPLLKKCAGFFLDFFAGRLPPLTHWITELSLVAIAVVIGTMLTRAMGLPQFLAGIPALRPYWLGVLIFLLWLCGRFTGLLLRLLAGVRDRYPDITRAFRSAVEEADRVQLDLKEVPLFLVIGTDTESETVLAENELIGSRLSVDDEDLTVHWRGNASAVWVTVPGVSAISWQHRATEEDNDEPGGVRLSHAERELARRRMINVMQRLRRLRGGVVPVNGVIVLVPFGWLQDERLANLVDAIKVDMAAAQNELGVRCHCSLIFHETERTPGFQALLENQSDDGRGRSLGCTPPDFSRYSPEDAAPLHEWMIDFWRHIVFREYARAADRVTPNRRMFQFVVDYDSTENQLAQILTRHLPPDALDRFYFNGVYFAELTPLRQSFVDGVLTRLLQKHDEVIGWSPGSLKADRQLHLMARLTAIAAIALLVVNTVLISRWIMEAWV